MTIFNKVRTARAIDNDVRIGTGNLYKKLRGFLKVIEF